MAALAQLGLVPEGATAWPSSTSSARRPSSGRWVSARLRILYAIPSLIVLAILLFFGAVAWVIAVVCVLVSQRYPEGLWRFLLGIVRWEARLFAYLASLVDRYPPFTLATSPVSPAAPPSS